MHKAFGKLSDFVESQGELFVLSIFLFFLIANLMIGTFILKKINIHKSQFFASLKDKLLWGAILRPIH